MRRRDNKLEREIINIWNGKTRGLNYRVSQQHAMAHVTVFFPLGTDRRYYVRQRARKYVHSCLVGYTDVETWDSMRPPFVVRREDKKPLLKKGGKP